MRKRVVSTARRLRAMWATRSLVPIGLLVTLLFPAVAVADDDEVSLRRMAFAERRGRLTVTTKFSELVDRRSFQRLSSGLPTTVLLRGWVFRDGGQVPIAFTLASIRVVYDLWDEIYTVTFDGPDGKRVRRYRSRIDVLEALTRLRRFPIANLSDVKVGPNYRLGLVVELNPRPQALLKETRRWLSKPAGKERLDISSSVFGSFVSIFVNPKLSEAERLLRFRSQPFYRVSQ
ncbi:MAG: hypothetical protein KJO07_19960 [Deltaproteobacteria bacterium]|nr:hypothetical protein [Deltaproteobacteria bacterium]